MDPHYGNLNKIISYQNTETMLFTIDPYYGNLKIEPLNKGPVMGSGAEALEHCSPGGEGFGLKLYGVSPIP